MTVKKWIAAAVLIDFAALHAWAFWSEGLQGILTYFQTMTPWAIVFFADLCIAISMILVWMWQDAKQRGKGAPIGYMIVALLSGSIGTLAYLLSREET